VARMDFAPTDRCRELSERLEAFMQERVHPAEAVYEEQLRAGGDPHGQPPIMEELKEEARARGLWNLFHPDPRFGAGLTYTEYAPLAEISGRSHIGPEAINCAAPDTGNMEVLTQFGDEDQQERWLRPLLDGEIRSAFAMTEPDVASSDARNIAMRIERDGDEYVLNGRKWWTSGAMRESCRILIVMGKTDPDAAPYRQQSMILVPRDTPGVTIVRNLPVFGYVDQEGHAEITFEDARVPTGNLIANEGDGFLIAQARLGPGRIHHCMRWIGVCRRAFDDLCERAVSKSVHGSLLSEKQMIQDWVATSAAAIEAARLLTLNAAWKIDQEGASAARTEIAMIKYHGAAVMHEVLDKAIQVHGALGFTTDMPLEEMYKWSRAARFYDGPDEVHKVTVAKRILRGYEPHDIPSDHIPTRREAAIAKYGELLDNLALTST
jgi:acyl-CoA dehydrogenase